MLKRATFVLVGLLMMSGMASAQSSFFRTVCEPMTPAWSTDSPTWTIQTGGAPGVFAGLIRAEGPVKSICSLWWNDNDLPAIRTLCDVSPATDRQLTGAHGPDVAVMISRRLTDGTWQWCVMGPVTLTALPGIIGPPMRR